MLVQNQQRASEVLKKRERKGLPNTTTIIGIRELEKRLQSTGIGAYHFALQDFLLQPCNQRAFLNRLEMLGQGAYGEAYGIQIEGESMVVVKESHNVRELINVYDANLVEARILELLAHVFLYPNHTPHLQPMFGFAQCAYRVRKGDELFDWSTFVLTKQAYFVDLYEYISKQQFSISLYELLRQIMFEVTYTLALIQTVYPQFVHNDMKLDNVLADVGPPTGHTEYIAQDEGVLQRFFVPNSGMRTSLWDFGLSSITGIIDNASVSQLHYTEPEFGTVAFRKNVPGWDLRVFADECFTNVLQHFIRYENLPKDNEFLQEWKTTWPGPDIPSVTGFLYRDFQEYILGDPNYDMKANVPSPMDVLLYSPLFEKYKSPPMGNEKPTHVYSMVGAKQAESRVLDNIYKSTMLKPLFTPVPLGFSIFSNPLVFQSIYSAQYYPRVENNALVEMLTTNNAFEKAKENIAQLIYKYNTMDSVKQQVQDVETAYNKTIALANRLSKNGSMSLIGFYFCFLRYYAQVSLNILTMDAMIGELGLVSDAWQAIRLAFVQWSWIKYYELDREKAVKQNTLNPVLVKIGDRQEATMVLNEWRKRRIPNTTTVMGMEQMVEKLLSGEYEIQTTRMSEKLGDFLLSPCGKKRFFKHLKFLGGGTYGQAYVGKVQGAELIVIKRSLYQSNITTMYSGSMVEPRMLQLFSSTMVMTGHTPHLPPLYGYAQCKVVGELDEKGNDHASFIVTKRAHYGDLGQYFKRFSQHRLDIARQVLFEITYTFALIQTIYPHFLHNDIKLNNVLADLGPAQGYTKYILPDNSVYYVPNSGMRSIVWDFDFASIPGILDNEKAIFFQYAEPENGIGAIRAVPDSAGIDLKVLAYSIMEYLVYKEGDGDLNALDSSFVQEWEETWGSFQDYTDGYYEVFVDDMEDEEFDPNTDMPSPMYVLKNSPLFKPFKTRTSTNITDTYSMQGVQRVSTLQLENLYTMIAPLNTNFEHVPPLGFGGTNGNFFPTTLSSTRFYSIPVPLPTTLVAWSQEQTREQLTEYVNRFYASMEEEERNESIDIAMDSVKELVLQLGPLTDTKWILLLALFYFTQQVDGYIDVWTINDTFEQYPSIATSLALVQWSWMDYMTFLVENVEARLFYTGTLIW